ncbi:MAG: AbrB family transcriptional regulator [Burkholderiaceae bacterium]|nr:AbrB family transcriptional regulator [Burkholderiaceae bacterium]
MSGSTPPPATVARRTLRLAATAVVALAGALAASALHLPLPWFTGPLLAVAIVNIAGAGLAPLPFARDGGQWIIGAALGLYFTPEVVREIVRLAPWILLTTAAMIALGLLGAWLLQRLTGERGPTAFFAMAIGGASEMAAQAERYEHDGARVDRVVAAHSLRLVLVALIVPFVMQAWGAQGTDAYAQASAAFSWSGLAVLAAVTGGGAIVLLRLGAPNVFMIGPLLVAAALTANGVTLTALPTPIVNAGQWLIGIALGVRFAPEFFRAAPRYLAAVAAVTLMYLAVAALFGAWLAQPAGLAAATAVLATTPGGIGEMAITAKVLKLGAPIVTAFHGIRMLLVVLTIGPLYRLLRARLARRS